MSPTDAPSYEKTSAATAELKEVLKLALVALNEETDFQVYPEDERDELRKRIRALVSK